MKRPLLTFFLLSYAVTWTCFTAAGALSRGASPGPGITVLREALILLAAITPGLVTLLVLTRTEGRAATAALLSRISVWRVGARWYVFALGFMLTLKLAAALAQRLILGAWPRFAPETLYVMLPAILISMWVQAGEEVGWRGYALPRLSARFGLGPASVLLGVIWAGWHLPEFYLPGVETTGQSFPVWALQVTALSVAFAWLYWRTDGSLLLVMLLHAAINNTKDIVPAGVAGATHVFSLSAAPVSWLVVALLWLAASYFLVQMRGVRTVPRAGTGRDTHSEGLTGPARSRRA